MADQSDAAVFVDQSKHHVKAFSIRPPMSGPSLQAKRNLLCSFTNRKELSSSFKYLLSKLTAYHGPITENRSYKNLSPTYGRAKEVGSGGKNNSSMTEESGSKNKKQEHKKDENVASWGSLRSLFSCRNQQELQSKRKKKKKCKKIRCTVSLCRTRESSSVSSPEVSKKLVSTSSFDSSNRSLKACNDISGAISTTFSSNSSASITASSASSSSSSLGGSFGAMHLRGFSGCYECHDPLLGPSRDPSMRLTISPCPDCGEIFMNPDHLEFHQTETHAVSELAAEDTSRKIIEIIFLSSWLKKQTPVSRIYRILRVHNSPSTISRFEAYRNSIKRSATKHPRCVADGNELLRFYCTNSACPLGLGGTTNLCQSTPHCSVCRILRDGFGAGEAGKIRTMATSGGAHVAAAQISAGEEKRAMLVCRVIAGRVKRSQLDAGEGYDSIAGTAAGICANVDELFVFSPSAILPCFVVIYRSV